MTAFAVRLNEIVAKTNRNLDGVVRGTVTDIATRLDEISPVGDPTLWKHPPSKDYQPGTFRGNWQIGVNFIPEGETGRIDPSGTETLSANIGAIGDHPAGTIIWIANNVPYARTIEDGHSTQAPAGLVGITAVEFQQTVDAVAMSLVS